VLIQSRGLVARFRDCARDERGDNMTAAVRIVVFRFFGDDDEQAVFFEQRALNERIDAGLEPAVPRLQLSAPQQRFGTMKEYSGRLALARSEENYVNDTRFCICVGLFCTS